MKIIFLFSALLFWFPPSNSASVCVVSGSPASELKHSAAVFSGEVIAREYLQMQSGEEEIVFRFRVKRVWKGNMIAEVLLHTSGRRTKEGLDSFLHEEEFVPELGNKYLVYADLDGERFRSQVCSRSMKLELATKDLRRLGQGWKPQAQQSIAR